MVQPFLGRNLMFKTAKILLAATMLAGSVGAAQAATIVLNNGAPYSEVVHANRAGSGTTLNTLTKHGDIPVALYSADGLDVGNGDGVAIVKGLGNGQGDGFSALLIDPSVGFSVMQFKIEDFGSDHAHDFDIQVNFVGGSSQTFSNYLLPNNSKIDIFAGPGEVLDSIKVYGLMSAAGAPLKFMDVKQISFDPVARGGVPEPASWAMMLAGFGLVVASMRRRKPVTVTA